MDNKELSKVTWIHSRAVKLHSGEDGVDYLKELFRGISKMSDTLVQTELMVPD